MSDNEIMKALECCVNGRCSTCPFNAMFCSEKVAMAHALDLINRQKAEIERLKKNQVVHIDIGEQLKKECEYEIKTARTEAIEEFAERLKALYLNNRTYDRPNAHTLIGRLFYNIDNLVKEMVGEQK